MNDIDQINMDLLKETVSMVEKKLKFPDQIDIKVGFSVGGYMLIENEGDYSIEKQGQVIYEGISNYKIASSILSIIIKDSRFNAEPYVVADHTYSKHLVDANVFKHIIETSNNVSAVMIAEDRLNYSMYKMQISVDTLSKLKNKANAAVFDK